MSNKKPGVVRLKKGKNMFEILVNKGTVEKFKQQKLGWNKVPFAEAVFKNSSKGDVYNDKDLEQAFGTTDVNECMKIIVNDGLYKLDASERKAKLAEKRKQIVTYFCKYYVDTKTKQAIPAKRIEAGLDKIKYNINIDESANNQIPKIMKQLKTIIFMQKVGQMNVKISIPYAHVGKCGGIISQYATIKSQTYDAKSTIFHTEVCVGDYDALTKQLGNKTKGDFTIDIEK